MSNQIRLKRGSGSNPSASDLVVGEVALRTDNGKLFTKKDDNSITEIGSGISDGDKGDITISNSGGTFTIDNGVIDNANINASAAIAGTKISPDFGSQNIVTTGFITSNDITIQDTSPRLQFTDTNHNDDFAIVVESGLFKIIDTTNNENRLFIHSDGEVDLWGHVDIGAGLDVTGEITATSHIDLPDNAKLKLGTSDDLQIYHDGSHSYALNTTGNLFLGSNSSVDIGDGDFTEYAARFTHDGAVQLYFDNSKKFETTSAGVQLIDNSRLVVGTGGDGEFYHDGSHTYLKDVGTGNLRLAADSTIVIQKNTGGETIANFIPDGAVELYHDNSKKFETTSLGTKIIGDLWLDNPDNAGKDIQFDSSANKMKFDDNVKANFGSGDDLEIYHDGSHSYIENTGTGHLYIIDAGIVKIQSESFKVDNADGTEQVIKANPNAGVEIYYDNSKKFETTSTGVTVTGQIISDGLQMGDNEKAKFGSHDDLQIYHDGSNSYIKQVSSATGDLLIFSDGHDIEFITQSGGHSAKMIPSGAVELYHDNSKKFATFSNGSTVFGDFVIDNQTNSGKDLFFDESGNILKHFDDVKSVFGDGNDLQIFHDGTSSFITNTGELFIRSNGSTMFLQAASNENAVKVIPNGAVELFFDNSKKFETTSTGVTVTGQIISDGLQMGDNEKAKFGSHDDLQIYHDGSNSYIKQVSSATGDLLIFSDGHDIEFITQSGGHSAKMIPSGAVELYHDNSKKLETTANGTQFDGRINFTGTGQKIDLTDNQEIRIGTGDDLQIFHDGNNSKITHGGAGGLYIGADTFALQKGDHSENYISMTANGAVELYYDFVLKLNTTSNGVTCQDDLAILDNNKITVGTGDDLQIFHNGTSSFIQDTAGASLTIQATESIAIKTNDTEFAIACNKNGGVELYHDNSKQFETTADGVDVQGNITIASANNAPKITFDENGANDPKAEIQMDQESGTAGKLIFKTEGGGTLRDRMTIQSDATVFFRGSHNNTADTEFEFLASTFSPFARFNHTANNAGHTFIQFRSNASQVGEIKDDGDGTCTYDTTSDYRLKENIVNITDGIERVKKLIPRRFNFKVAPGYTKDGFIAHELQEVVPEAVHGTKDELVTEESKASFPTLSDKKVGDPVYQTADISRVVPLLAAGLKEAIAKIEVLETEVAALKAG